MSNSIRAFRIARAKARNRKQEQREDLIAACIAIFFALIVAAPWIMLAAQIPTYGSW
jgi:uncharacterized membrane protein affecting hemolysin expression